MQAEGCSEGPGAGQGRAVGHGAWGSGAWAGHGQEGRARGNQRRTDFARKFGAKDVHSLSVQSLSVHSVSVSAISVSWLGIGSELAVNWVDFTQEVVGRLRFAGSLFPPSLPSRHHLLLGLD